MKPFQLILVVIVLFLAAALIVSSYGCTSHPYVDMSCCRMRAACIKCAIAEQFPDMETRQVTTWRPSEDYAHTHIEAYVNGEWKEAVWFNGVYGHDIIEFY